MNNTAMYLVQVTDFKQRKDGTPAEPGTLYLNSLGGNTIPKNCTVIHPVIAESQGLESGKTYLIQIEDTGTNNDKGYPVYRHLRIGENLTAIEMLRIRKEHAADLTKSLKERGLNEEFVDTDANLAKTGEF